MILYFLIAYAKLVNFPLLLPSALFEQLLGSLGSFTDVICMLK